MNAAHHPLNVRVKVCGITTPTDALHAASAGVDAIGLNLVAGPRMIDMEAAGRVLSAVPLWCTPVVLAHTVSGVITPETLTLVDDHRVRGVQLYGDVDARMLKALSDRGVRSIVVQAVASAEDLGEIDALLGEADLPSGAPAAVLIDARIPGKLGGGGVAFDWRVLADARQAGRLDDWPPLILAGGLTPANVAEAVRVVAPAAVDAASGVERSPGVKDANLMRAFVAAARSALP